MATRICGLLLGVVGSFVFCSASFAQYAGKIHNFSVAPEVSSYEYKEPSVMKYTGTMYGLSAEYLNHGGVGRIKNSIPIQFRARFTYMYGKLDYDGQLMSGVPYKFTGAKNYFIDTVLAGGMEFKLGGDFSVSPYLGFGYRYLEDKGDADPAAYKREQVYYYLPIGADWKKTLSPTWSLAFNTEVDVLLRGENTTHLSDKMKFRQDSGYGLRFAAKVEKNLQSVGIFAEPFFRYWDIDKSNVKYGFLEPKNKTTEFGLRVGFSF